MDDSFSFVTTVPLDRRVGPRPTKATILLAGLLIGVWTFASWVAASERESFARADRRTEATRDLPPDESVVASTPIADGGARDAVRAAVEAARWVLGHDGSLRLADPAALSALRQAYLFVDGASTTPSVVSIATGGGSWAAAVRGWSGECHWARLSADGALTTGTGSDCSGSAALHAVGRGPRATS
jgi:hypothetical protein